MRERERKSWIYGIFKSQSIIIYKFYLFPIRFIPTLSILDSFQLFTQSTYLNSYLLLVATFEIRGSLPDPKIKNKKTKTKNKKRPVLVPGMYVTEIKFPHYFYYGNCVKYPMCMRQCTSRLFRFVLASRISEVFVFYMNVYALSLCAMKRLLSLLFFFLRKVIWIGRSIRSTYKMRDKSNNKMHRKQINREHSQQIALTIFHTIPQSLSLSVHLLNATYHDLCIPRHSSFSPSINPKQFLILFCVDNREIHFNRINLQRSTELLFFSFFFLFSWTNKKNFVLFFIRFGLSILCSYCVSIRIIFVQWYREWADKIYR